MFEFTLHRRRIVKFLSVTAGFLILMHGILATWNYGYEEINWYLLQLFDVNEEHNLPTWFSGFNLLVATLFLGIITMQKRKLGDDMARRWTVLFAGFCFLSIDEIAGLHETVNSVIDPSWAWGGLVIVILVGLYFIPFLRSLPRRTLIHFVLAGAVFVGGAVIMELVGQPLDSDELAYNLTTMVEEGMEMFGVVLFTRALLAYMMAGNDSATVSLRS